MNTSIGHWLVLLAIGLAPACGDPATASSRPVFEIEIRVANDDGTAVAGAKVSFGATPVGTTGADGVLEAHTAADEGSPISVSVVCPDGYTGPSEPAVVRLTRTRSLHSARPHPTRVGLTCQRNTRDIVIVVRAQGAAGVGTQVDGKSLGVLDDQGIGHYWITVDRQVRNVAVTLDTSFNQTLRPRNPSRVYDLSGNDAVLLFEQAFARATKPARGSRTTKHVPYRID